MKLLGKCSTPSKPSRARHHSAELLRRRGRCERDAVRGAVVLRAGGEDEGQEQPEGARDGHSGEESRRKLTTAGKVCED